MAMSNNGAAKLMKNFLIAMFTLSISHSLWADQIGSVSTKFKILGANDKIVIEAFDDPDVPGATCYLSRAKTGGVSGMVGWLKIPQMLRYRAVKLAQSPCQKKLRMVIWMAMKFLKSTLRCSLKHCKSCVSMMQKEMCWFI